MEKYRARPIRNLGLWEPGGWKIKVYGIAYDREHPRSELVAAAKNVASERLTSESAKTQHYGLGFLTIHDGRDAGVALLDWWADENELHHHVYVAPKHRPEALRSGRPEELTACVWDLEVIAFERAAWVRHVLACADDPRWDDYLAARLSAKAPVEAGEGTVP